MKCRYSKEKSAVALNYVNRSFHKPGHMDLVSFIEEADKFMKTLSKKEVDSVQKDVLSIISGSKKGSFLRKSMRRIRGGSDKQAALDAAQAMSEGPEKDAALDAAKAMPDETANAAVNQPAANETVVNAAVNQPAANETVVNPAVNQPAANETVVNPAVVNAAAVVTTKNAPLTQEELLKAISNSVGNLNVSKNGEEEGEEEGEEVPEGTGDEEGEEVPEGTGEEGEENGEEEGVHGGSNRSSNSLIFPRSRTGLIYSGFWIAIFSMAGFSNQDSMKKSLNAACLQFTRRPLCSEWKKIVFPIIESSNQYRGVAKTLSNISPMNKPMNPVIYKQVSRADYFITKSIQHFCGKAVQSQGSKVSKVFERKSRKIKRRSIRSRPKRNVRSLKSYRLKSKRTRTRTK